MVVGMSKKPEIRDRILQKAREQFFRLGFSKVTMDEMAADLGVSKKTIYRHFPSKDKILQDLMVLKLSEIEKGVTRILQDTGNDFLEKLRETYTFLGLQLAEIGQPFLRDLERNAPEVWRKVETRRHKIVQRIFGDLFSEGIKKGTFKNDVNPQLLTLIYTTLIQRIMTPETLSQLPLSASQTLDTIRKVIFEGILTDKARTQYRSNQSRAPREGSIP